jgi:hypothetical protein
LNVVVDCGFMLARWWIATRFDMANSSMSRIGLVGAGVLVLALVAQSAYLYPRLRVQKAENAALRESIEFVTKRETQSKSQEQAVPSEELTRLRKDNQELHRLRNEVRQLREATAQASKAAQAPAPTAPAPATALVTQLQRQVQQLQAENQQLRAAQQQVLQGQVQAQGQIGPCINNLRHLDGAKQQWALENRQPAEAIPNPADIEPYLNDGALWNCPAGGVYTLNAVGTPPTCSVPGHALP